MQLVSLQMRGSVARNTSSVLFGDVMVRNGIFWTIGEQSYFVYYPIISYQRIKVYKFERMDIGKILMTNWCQWDM